jgi:accessory gene regulator B
LINKLADNISEYLVVKYPADMPSKVVTRYAVKFLISNILPILLIIFFSALMGNFKEVFVAILGFAVLRMFSGGYHLKSALMCILLSTILISLVPITGNMLTDDTSIILLNGLSLILVTVFAPSNITKQTRVKKKYHFLFKLVSMIIILSNFFIMNTILAVSFLFQSVLLIRLKGGGIK